MCRCYYYCGPLLFVVAAAVRQAAATKNIDENNEEISNLKYDDNGLWFLYTAAKQFLDLLQPESGNSSEVLYQQVLNLTSKESDNSQADLIGYFERVAPIIARFVGYVVLLACGLLFALGVPIVGIIVCCCRCRGRCGGRLQQKGPSRICCGFLSTTLCVLVLFLVATTMCFTLHSFRIYDDVLSIPNQTHVQVNGVLQFANRAINEVAETTLEYSLAEVDNVSLSLNRFLGESLDLARNSTDETNLISMLGLFQHLVLASQTFASDESFKSATEAMNSSFLSLRQALQTAESAGYIAAGTAAQLNVNEVQLTLESIEKVREDSIELLQPMVVNPSQITNQINGTISRIDEAFGKFSSQLYTGVETMKNKTITVVTQTVKNAQENNAFIVAAERISNMSNGLFHQSQTIVQVVKEYTWTKYVLFLLITAPVVLILMFLLLGLACGCYGYRSDIKPYERGISSNAGGNCLVVATVLCFALSWLLMIFALLLLTIGYSGEIVCKTVLHDPEDFLYVLEQLQQRNIIPPMPYNISARDLFYTCKENQSLFEAVDLRPFLRLDELQLPRTLSVNFGQLNQTLPRDNNLITPNVRNSLQQLKKALNATSNSLISAALATHIREDQWPNMETLKMNIQNMNFSQDSEKHRLESLIDDSETTLQLLNATMFNASNTMQSLATTTNEIHSLLDHVTAASSSINQTMQSILDNTQHWIQSMSTALNESANQLVHDVIQNSAQCYPLYQSYVNFGVIFCDYFLNPVHGVWFPLLFCVAAFIPCIVFALRLSKYFRRMRRPPLTTTSDEEEGERFVDYSSVPDIQRTAHPWMRPAGNLVYPQQPSAPPYQPIYRETYHM